MVSKALTLFSQTIDWVGSKLGIRERMLPTPLSYYELVEMFKKPGCAVCNLLLRDADRFLDNLLYELALDTDIHRAFRARRGLCNEHSWQALQYRGMSLGIAILYEAALDEVLQIMEETADQEAASGRGLLGLRRRSDEQSLLAERLEPDEPCIVCRLVAGAERRYIQALGQYVADSRLRDAYLSSENGLCLPHFRQALLGTQDLSNRQQLASIQKVVWSRLKADLNGMIGKSNYLHSHEMTKVEGISWRRVIRITGERGVFGPDPRAER